MSVVISISSVLMAPSTPTKGPEQRPGSLRNTKSFPRHQVSESNDPLSLPQRANTFHNGTVPEIMIEKQSRQDADTFESESNHDPIEPPRASVDMDEIPIELVSTTDK